MEHLLADEHGRGPIGGGLFDTMFRSRRLLVASLLCAFVSAPADASTPPLIWQNAKRVVVMCNVAGGPGIDHLALTAQLCARVQPLAARGSPFPVQTVGIGDPAVLAPNTVALLVHASVSTSGTDRLLAFSIRPYRASAEDGDILFGAAPRAAAISATGAATPALEAALAAALADTLPWQNRPQGPRPLPGRP